MNAIRLPTVDTRFNYVSMSFDGDNLGCVSFGWQIRNEDYIRIQSCYIRFDNYTGDFVSLGDLNQVSDESFVINVDNYDEHSTVVDEFLSIVTNLRNTTGFLDSDDNPLSIRIRLVFPVMFRR